MIWQLFLVGYLILGVVAYLLRRHLAVSLTKHNRLVHGFFYLCVLYPTSLLITLFSDSNLSIGWQNFMFIVAGSVIFPILLMLSYKSSKDLDAGLYTILCDLAPIITIIAATVLLHEGLNGRQLTGASIVIGSAFLATLPQVLNRTIHKTAGIKVALLSILVLGIAVVYERWMLTRMDLGAYFFYGWGAQTLWMVMLAWKDRKNIGILREKKHFWPVLVFALAFTFKSVFFIIALKMSGNASLVIAFASFVSVMVVIAAYYLLRERDHFWYKAGAGVVGAIGLIILNT